MKPCAWLALVPLLLLPAARAGAEARVDDVLVDRVVVVVGAVGEQGAELRIVTAFELEVEARLLLAERTRSLDAALRNLDSRFLGTVRDTIVNQLLIVGEATRLQLVTLEDDAVAAERQSLEARLGGPGSIERFCSLTHASNDLVDQIIRRRLLATSYIQQNIQLSFTVTESDLVEAHRDGNHPFGDRDLEEIRGQLQAFILARRQRQRLVEWLQESRERSRIRVIEP